MFVDNWVLGTIIICVIVLIFVLGFWGLVGLGLWHLIFG